MKKLYTIALALFCVATLSAKSRGVSMLKNDAHIVVVGLAENVKSNYYLDYMIEEETAIPKDSICAVYNRTVAEQISHELGSDNVMHYAQCPEISNEIKVSGEKEEVYSDINSVDAEVYSSFLEREDAKYMLVINQHYLKWQREPLRTLFHFVSYTLYNDQKQEVSRGCKYFTSMNTLNGKELRKKCKKTSGKIAESLVDELIASN